MKIKLLLVLVVLVVLTSCTKKNTFQFPVIVDEYLRKDGTSADVFSVEEFNHPYYFGKMKDTIFVGRQIISFPQPAAPPPPFQNNHKDKQWFLDSIDYTQKGIEYWKIMKQIEKSKSNYKKYLITSLKEKSYRQDDSIQLSIKIDTTQNINKGVKKAFPVLIRNLSKDTITIGEDDFLYLYLEAKDREGNWGLYKRSFKLPASCILEYSQSILPPYEIVLTSQMIYDGDFKTKLRLKMFNNYSKEFWGAIDEAKLWSNWEKNRSK